MNSNKYPKYMKNKVLPNFIMGQKNATASSSQSSCSIFSVDEDVKFVVENGDPVLFSTTMPLDKNLELACKTYSKKSPLSFPSIAPSSDPFEFSVIPEDKSLSPNSLKPQDKMNKRRGSNGKFKSVAPKRILKTDIVPKAKSAPVTNRTRESSKRKVMYVESEASSDSDIEVLEIKVVNPNALNSQSINNVIKRSIKKEKDSNNKRRNIKDYVELSNKKTESKPNQLQVSKSGFKATDSELIGNGTDTAHYMPNNPNTFPDMLTSTKWLSTSSPQKSPQKNNNCGVVCTKESSIVAESKPSLLKDLKLVDVKGLRKRSELKILYEQLEEISWTKETSFKELLRNPERNTARLAEANKVLKGVKETLPKPAANSRVRNIHRIKATLKNKLANKKLAKLAPKSKINKFSINNLSRPKFKVNKKGLAGVPKLSQKGSKITKVPKDGEKIKPAELKIKRSPITELKNKKSSTEKVDSKKKTKPTNLKKQNIKDDPEKPKVKAKTETSKANGNLKMKPSILGKEKMLKLSKPKVEISEASSSGVQSSQLGKYSSLELSGMCDADSSKEDNLEKPNQLTNLFSKRFEILQEYKKKDHMFSPIHKGSDCRVNLEPLEHSSLRSTEYYDDFRKQYFHQALRKDSELIVNETDTAPYMPNNPNTFPDMLTSTKWLNTRSPQKSPQKNNNCGVVCTKESSIVAESKPSLSKDIKLVEVKGRKERSSQLKILYDQLEQIPWTKETSFKKLLHNPERSTARLAETSKAHKEVKETLPKPAANSRVRNIHRIKATLKNKLANKKIAKLTSKNKMNKFSINKLSRPKLKVNKKGLAGVPKFSQKGSKITKVPKDGDKIKPAELKIKRSPITELKDKKNSTKKVDSKKKTKPTNLKKQNIKDDPEKPKVKAKKETSKANGNLKMKPSILGKEKMLKLSKPRVEISEASSSGVQSSQLGKCSSFELSGLCDADSSREDSFERPNKLEKDHMYSAVHKGSQCCVNLEPLEHSSLRNTEYYDDFRKQYFHQALRKAMEKREPNYIATVLQEFCDSYMNPTIEDKVSKKRKPEEESLRSSARQIGGSLRYKEIVVKKHPNYMQVVLVPNGIKKNSLSIEAIKELRDAFLLAKKDIKCRAVLLNSSGSYFCTGIDLSQLIGPNKKQACEEMAAVIRELVLVLSAFTKPLIAAVNGATVGFGVSLLTYCDIVFASDKATFCVPSLSIGYLPEGGLTLTLPQIIGNIRCCEMLLQGTRLTASQAHQKGLVTEVLWPSRFMNEVMPRLMSVISQPLPVMEATKLLVRANIWDKLRSHMDVERRLLVNHWLTPQCQDNIKRVLRLDSLID